MTKTKNAFIKIFLILLMFIMCITVSACGASKDDLKDEFGDDWEDDWGEEGGGNDDDLDMDLLGVKVLRRPLVKTNPDGTVSGGYDFDNNVTDKDGNYGEDADPTKKDFFYSLSEDIIMVLFTTYGNFNTFTEADGDLFGFLSEKTQNEVVDRLANDFNGDDKDKFKFWYDVIRHPIESFEDKGEGNFVVTANSENAWAWSLPYDATDYPSVIKAHESVGTNSAGFASSGSDIAFTYEGFADYYSNQDYNHPFATDKFQAAYVNEDYKNALAYAIYSSVLGSPIANITVTYNGGAPSVQIGDYLPTEEETSAKRALNNVRETFKRLGAYVGLTETNKTAVKNFVLNNIIGSKALSFSGKVADYYYQDVVSAIVDYCATQTVTGTASSEEGGGGQTNVGSAWLASEVVDFPYETFFVSDTDEAKDMFNNTGGAFEYQSFVLLPSREDFVLDDMWLEFKYDAENDGDDKVVEGEALDIDVIVRWNKGDGTPIKQIKQSIHVVDGPADPLEDGTQLEFGFDSSVEEGGMGEPIVIGKFKTPQALKTNILHDFAITLNGLTDARRYYKVLDGENGGVYGVLNEDLIEGSYCEVAFDVKKDANKPNKNYAFYLGIFYLGQEMEYPDDPEWH